MSKSITFDFAALCSKLAGRLFKFMLKHEKELMMKENNIKINDCIYAYLKESYNQHFSEVKPYLSNNKTNAITLFRGIKEIKNHIKKRL